MEVSNYIVPASVIVIANLFSGDRNSKSWEAVSTVFGVTVFLSTIFYLVGSSLYPENALVALLPDVAVFCLVSVLARDYEKILASIFLRR